MVYIISLSNFLSFCQYVLSYCCQDHSLLSLPHTPLSANISTKIYARFHKAPEEKFFFKSIGPQSLKTTPKIIFFYCIMITDNPYVHFHSKIKQQTLNEFY